MTSANGAATRVKSLSEAHMATQKKTFTKWANVYLMKHRQTGRAPGAVGVAGEDRVPNSTVSGGSWPSTTCGDGCVLTIGDLEKDLRDGKLLIKLVEALSGDVLPPPEKFDMRIHHLQNVGKTLRFLNAKYGLSLANIGPEDIVNGNVKLTLGLIWQLILIYQLQHVKAAEKHKLAGTKPLPNSTLGIPSKQVADSGRLSSSGYPPTPPASPGTMARSCPSSAPTSVSTNRRTGGPHDVKSSLLSWSRAQLSDHVAARRVPPVVDFGSSWRDGRAFLGLLHSYRTELVPDFMEAVAEDSEQDLTDDKRVELPEEVRKRWKSRLSRAFSIAEKRMGIPRLLEPEDLLDVDIPDEKSVLTFISGWYIAMIQATEPLDVELDFDEELRQPSPEQFSVGGIANVKGPLSDGLSSGAASEVENQEVPFSKIEEAEADNADVGVKAACARAVNLREALNAGPIDYASLTTSGCPKTLSPASPSYVLPSIYKAAPPSALEPSGTPQTAVEEISAADLLSATSVAPLSPDFASKSDSSETLPVEGLHGCAPAPNAISLPPDSDAGVPTHIADYSIEGDLSAQRLDSLDLWTPRESVSPRNSGSTVYHEARSTASCSPPSSSSWHECPDPEPSPPSSIATSPSSKLHPSALSASLNSVDDGLSTNATPEGPPVSPTMRRSSWSSSNLAYADLKTSSTFTEFRDPFRAAFASAPPPPFAGVLSDVTTAAISMVLLPMLSNLYAVVGGALRIDLPRRATAAAALPYEEWEMSPGTFIEDVKAEVEVDVDVDEDEDEDEDEES